MCAQLCPPQLRAACAMRTMTLMTMAGVSLLSMCATPHTTPAAPSAVRVNMQDLLTGPELALLASWKHRPNCAGQVGTMLGQHFARMLSVPVRFRQHR